MPKRIPRYLFDRRDYKMLSLVNEVISSGRTTPFAHIELYVHFHPEGIKELAESRGLRIAYATILLLQSLTTGRLEDRLGALSALRDEVIDTAIGPMPQNTARVLLQIMKELVRAHGDQRRQLELAHDFRAAASGKPRVIRRQLREYHLIEMPEAWNQVAFDDHVHDANTKGRKSPTHLILDAWIKGIRRLRVIYYNHISSKSATELMQAAQIMGITLRMGIEFAARFRNTYAQLIWVPRGFHDDQAFLCFLEEPEAMALMQEGARVSAYQEKYVCALLHAFNARHREAFNAAYDIELPLLGEVEFKAYVAPGQASLLHLAKYIHAQFLSLLPQKMARLRTAHASAADDTERRRIEAQVDRLNRLSADTILGDYLKPRHNPEIPDASVPRDDPSVPALLKLSPKAVIDRLLDLRSAYRITLNLSSLQVEDVLEILYDCEGKVTRLEIFNLKDYAAGLTEHIPPILALQQAINHGNVIALKRIIRQAISRLAQADPPDTDRIERLTEILHDIISLKAYYAGVPLVSRIGSDSTGGAPYSHGMGLVVDDTLPWRSRHDIRRKDNDRLRLPIALSVSPMTIYRPPAISGRMSGMMTAVRRLPGCSRVGLRRENHWETLEHDVRLVPEGNIVTLGGIQGVPENGLRLSPQPDAAKSVRRAPYLNNLLKNGLKLTIGFIPAFATFALTKDWWLLAYGGAFIWFGITGLRNIVQSVLGGGGWRRSPLLRWNDLISWERITDSLLYTGFSVPLLDYVTKTVLLERGWNITTATQPVMLYTLMALANGIYLSSHNIFRGLPRGAVVGNFFRSILSIPLAVGLNAGIGFALTGLGFGPAAPILQKWAAIISKAASDVVAGIIEGAADRFQNIDRRRRAIKNKIKQILDTYTELEILLPEAQAMEYLQNPEKIRSVPADAQDMAKRMYVPALDLLYFWMYQPRARNAFKTLMEELSPDESRIVLQAQTVLHQQRPISQLFIDGILGQGFSKPLAFYLDQSPAYLAAIEALIVENEAAYVACCQATIDPKVLEALQSKRSKNFSARGAEKGDKNQRDVKI